MKHYQLLVFSFVLPEVFLWSSASGEGNLAPWTTEEQKLLEQALKTYPVSTPERWEKIAAAVPGRTKKDCMKRYKVRDLSPRTGLPLRSRCGHRKLQTILWFSSVHLQLTDPLLLPQELVEMVKAKKAAQEQVAAKSKK